MDRGIRTYVRVCAPSYSLLPSRDISTTATLFTNLHLLSYSSSISMGRHLPYQTLAFCRIYYSIHVFYQTASSLLSRVKTTIWACSHSNASSSVSNLSISFMSLLFFNSSFFCLIKGSTYSKS